MEKQIIFEGCKGKLFGILHISEEEKSPGIILFHGFTGNKCESHFIFTKLARRLCKEGFSVLRFDFYGCGDSEGNFEEMTLFTEMKDGEKAFEYINSLDFIEKDKIGVLGISMGAIIAVYTASKFNQIKGLCLWSPLAFPLHLKRKILTKKMSKKIEKEKKIYIPEFGHYIGKGFIESLEQINIDEYVKDYKGNILIIHTKDDISVDLKHPFYYFERFHKNSSNLKLVIFNKGGHTFTTEESEIKLIQETTNFFKETLNH